MGGGNSHWRMPDSYQWSNDMDRVFRDGRGLGGSVVAALKTHVVARDVVGVG